MRVVKLATCTLNQWAMDFEGNLARTKQSIREARDAGATFRVGPELELCGYGCEDHFLEGDTLKHSWECMAEILASDLTNGIVCDIGLPVEGCGVRYNCRAYCLDGQILLIRPKLYLANDGNYRELRWFSSWKRLRQLETFRLPECITEVTGQETVPFGDGYLSFEDTGVASETCEELFTPSAPHIGLSLGGVEIIANGSGSHHQLRKLNTRIELMRSATGKCGGVYLYANQKGCDGGRLYYDGSACIMVNGDVVAQGSQFSMKDIEVVTACVNLDNVSGYRGTISSLREQASQEPRTPSIPVKFKLSRPMNMTDHFDSNPIQVRYHDPYEEIALGPACWLWDYLRRSGATGYLLPLSGGADSSSVAAIVGSMCKLVVKAVMEGDKQVTGDAVRIGNYKNNEVPESAEEFAQRLLHTVYMGTENSSEATRGRAKRLAEEVGASHLNVNIDVVVQSLLTLFGTLFPGKKLRYKVHGGSHTENLALQNIQARIRMVIAFMLASLLPWVRSKPGFLLVLGSANVDEGLRGYLTKYDCSSADINPIGGISKGDLRAFLRWGALNLGYKTLAEVEGAPPTAELEPITEMYTQTDEVDMGMTYEELGMYGRLRKIFRCGPVAMFENLCIRWHGRLTPAEVAQKVKDFFKYYSINRHKMTTLTPSYHAETYSPEDNRYDLRQFLYNTRWPWQFRRIDQLVEKYEASMPEPIPELRQHMQPTAAEAAAPHAIGLGVPAASSGVRRGSIHSSETVSMELNERRNTEACLPSCGVHRRKNVAILTLQAFRGDRVKSAPFAQTCGTPLIRPAASLPPSCLRNRNCPLGRFCSMHQSGNPMNSLGFECHAPEPRVPLLTSMGEEERALVKAIESSDTDLVYFSILHIWRQKPLPDFFRIIQSNSLARNLFIAYTRVVTNVVGDRVPGLPAIELHRSQDGAHAGSGVLHHPADYDAAELGSSALLQGQAGEALEMNLLPPLKMHPGTMQAKNFTGEAQAMGHIATGNLNMEVVDDDGAPMLSRDMYVHHKSMQEDAGREGAAELGGAGHVR